MAQLDQLLEPYTATRLVQGSRVPVQPLSLAILRARLLTELLPPDTSTSESLRR